LFIRELALPYVLIAFYLAVRERRRGEGALWFGGLVLYGLFMTYHGWEVTRRLTEIDRVEPDGWVQFGGARFLMAASQMNAYLFNLPAWVAGAYLVFSLLGLAGWHGNTGTRVGLTVFAYVAAFSIVGKPYNGYWGLMIAPLLTFGLVQSPAATGDLFHAIRLARRNRLAAVSDS
jgi:hypothetical protein